MRLSVRQALAPFVLAFLAGCASTPAERTVAASPPPASTSPTWARPELLSPSEAAGLRTALSGKTLVARRTDAKSGEVEAVFYGPGGKAESARVGARDRFDWALGSRSMPRGDYVYLARNGAGDGAPLTFWPERRTVAFSDGKLGPYFSTAVIADCWPTGLAGAPPATARPCKPAEEREVSQRLDAAVAKVAPLRQTAT